MNKVFRKLSVTKLTANFAEAVKIVTQPLQEPAANEVLIKNIYAGVNASDVNITAGRYFTDAKVPFDVGFEGLGVIAAVGKNVKRYNVGQPTLYLETKAYSEYVYAKPDNVIPIPELKPKYLTSLVSGLTASIALDRSGHIKKGETVLITAAAGGTGHICVQWAKSKGCHVIGTTSSPEKVRLLQDIGCDRVIDYKKENLSHVLKNEYPKGIDVIWESIGGEIFNTLVKHLKIKGRLIVIGSISGYISGGSNIDTNITQLTNRLIMKSNSLNGFLLTQFTEDFPQYLPKLMTMLANNELKSILDFGDNSSDGQFAGIESVMRAVEHLHSGKSTGKVVVKIQEP
ncbi:prostaglandin reductase-3-like [Oppia nitens]|uniref:prostaglandin reductase-3-like n=1 Tax=Oppia nitens TaxID=1686743 RepID=UPI0023D9D396|nr:prostaglandin reductase-3-like [Oppia nitens]